MFPEKFLQVEFNSTQILTLFNSLSDTVTNSFSFIGCNLYEALVYLSRYRNLDIDYNIAILGLTLIVSTMVYLSTYEGLLKSYNKLTGEYDKLYTSYNKNKILLNEYQVGFNDRTKELKNYKELCRKYINRIDELSNRITLLEQSLEYETNNRKRLRNSSPVCYKKYF